MELFECSICKIKSFDREDFEYCDECEKLVCIKCSTMNSSLTELTFICQNCQLMATN